MRHFTVVTLMLLLSACATRQPYLTNGKPTLRVAEAAMKAGSPQLAVNVSQSILVREPFNVPARLMLADAQYSLAQFPEAEASYNTILKVEPSNAEAHLGLGRIRLANHEPRDAEAEFRRALQQQPRQADALNNLGICLDMQKRPSEAQGLYRQVLGMDPGSVATRVNLAMSLLSTGDREGARTVLEPALSRTGVGPIRDDVATVQRMIDGGGPVGGAAAMDPSMAGQEGRRASR